MIRAIATFILLQILHLGNAQVLQPYLDYTHFTVLDGLPYNSCNVTIQDDKGFLWIGTTVGLARYDGKNMTNFSKNNPKPTELGARTITYLNIIQDELYISGFYGVSILNLNTYKAKNYTHYYKDDSLVAWSEAFEVFRDSKGRIWVGSVIDGPILYNSKKDRFECYKLSSDALFSKLDWVVDFYETPAGQILFPCLQGMVLLENDKSVRCFPFPSFPDGRKKNRARLIRNCFSKPNCMAVSVDDYGFYKFNYVTGEYYQIRESKSNQPVYATTCIEINNQKILNGHILHLFNEEEERITKLENTLSFIKNVTHLYITKDGRLWLSCVNGLYRINMKPSPIEYLGFQKDFYMSSMHIDTLSNSIRAMTIYGNHNINELNLNNGRLTALNNNPHASKIRVAKQFVEIDNNYYIASFNGLWKLDKSQLNPIAIVDPKELINLYNTLNLIVYHHWLLIGGVPNGPLLYNTRDKKYIFLNQDVVWNGVKFMASAYNFDRHGHIYVSQARGNRITKLDTSGSVIDSLKLPLAIENQCTNPQLQIDKEDNIWINISNHGVYKYDKKRRRWVSFYNEQSFDILDSENLVYDQDRTIYQTSIYGLYAIDIYSNTVNRIDQKYKLSESGSVCYDVIPYTKGKVIASGFDGHFYVLQSASESPSASPFLFVEQVRVMGEITQRSLRPQEAIVLKENQNSFSIFFGVAFISDAINVIYEAKLKDVDKGWRELGKLQEISYAGIAPGKYILELKAISSTNSFETIIREVPIIVKAAWYQTLVFKLLAALTILGLIAFALRNYYLRQLSTQKNELDKQIALAQERNRIAADMHDDLGAGLSQIRFLSNEASFLATSQELKNILDKTKHKSDLLVDNMNDIIWSLNNNEQNLQELFYQMRGQFAELLEARDIAFDTEISQNCSNTILNAIQSRNLYLVTKEAIHNSIKHSECSHINITLTEEQNQVQIVVSDNGKGFEINPAMMKGNGLNNYYKRMELINGTVNIESETTGTSIRFNFPL